MSTATEKPPSVSESLAKNKASLFMLGGGQKEISEDDLKARTMTFRVNIECKTDEKEVTATVPIYEHPLLSARYRSLGGEARLTAQWLPSKSKFTRVVPLSLDMLRDEVTRLEGSYTVHMQNGGKKSLFKEVYGRDGDPIKGFYRVINLQVKAWNKLQEMIRNGHRLSDEDLQAISDLAKPVETFDAPMRETDFQDASIEDSADQEDETPSIQDPMADLQAFLTDRNWETAIIMDLCKMMGDGEGANRVNVKDLPSLHGKRAEQTRLMADFRSFMAQAEKIAARSEVEASSKDAEKEFQH